MAAHHLSVRRVFTQPIYDALVAAFRDTPGKISEVARKVGVYRSTAKKAWETGWPDRPGWTAIKDVFQEEQEQIRAALVSQVATAEANKRKAVEEDAAKRELEQQKIRDLAKQDAISIGVDEVRVVRASQINARAALAASNAALQGAYRQLSFYRDYIEKMPAQELQEKVKDPLHMAHVFKAARVTAYIGKVATEVAKTTMEMERIRTGRPVAVVGVELVDLTPQQALEELEAAQASLRDAVEAGLMVPPPAGEQTVQTQLVPVPMKAAV